MLFYHFTNSDHGLSNLRKKRLKIAEIDKLNDPFEFLGADARDKETRKLHRTRKSELAKQKGLLCFSGNWTNPVQWSHYADNHKGICMGFEIAQPTNLIKIEYREHRIRLSSPPSKVVPCSQYELDKKIVGTKFRHWQYEDEHRLLVDLDAKNIDGGLYFYDFTNVLRLRKIIIGAASDISSKQINEALGEQHPKITHITARLAFRSFRVVEQRDPARQH